MLIGPLRLALLVNMHFQFALSLTNFYIIRVNNTFDLSVWALPSVICLESLFSIPAKAWPLLSIGLLLPIYRLKSWLASCLCNRVLLQRTSIVLHLQVWRDKSNLHDPLELLQEYFDFRTVLEHILQGRHQLSRNCFCRKSKDCSFLHYVNFWNFIVFCILATIITNQDSNLNKTVALDTPLFCLESVDEIYRIPSIAICWLSIKRNYAEVIHYNLDCSTEWSHKSQALNQ